MTENWEESDETIEAAYLKALVAVTIRLEHVAEEAKRAADDARTRLQEFEMKVRED